MQTTEKGVPQGKVTISSESLPSATRSVPMRSVRFAEPKLRFVDVVPPQPTASKALAVPSLNGEVLKGLPASSHSAGGACGTRPSGGRVLHVTAFSAQLSSGTKIAWWFGSPLNANPVKLVSSRLALVIVAPAGIAARLKRSRPTAGPVPQPYDEAPP